MQTKIIERYFFFGLLLTTLVFTFLIFKPFWIVLVLGVSLSVTLYPIFEYLEKKMPGWLASLLTLFFFIIVLCGPLFGIGLLVFHESQDLYRSVVADGSAIPFLNSIDEKFNNFLPTGITFDFRDKVSELISFTADNITKIFSSTLSVFVSFFLTLFTIFYFLKDGAKWKRAVIVLSPLSDQDDKKIINHLSKAINGVIKGYLLIAVLQGLLLGVGLAIFGVPNPALWGVVAGVASLLPMMGTAFVSVPAIIFLFVVGNIPMALGLLAWALIVVGTVDNILNPMFISHKINIPSLLILFSVLGGIYLLGPVGILIGPLTLSLLYTLISIYRNEFSDLAL